MQKYSRFLRRNWAKISLLAFGSVTALASALNGQNASAEIRLSAGETATMPVFGHHVEVSTSNDSVIRLAPTDDDHRIRLVSEETGDAAIWTKWLGVVPFRRVQVHVVKPHSVIVGGEAVGIRLNTDGALVVGYRKVGNTGSPAAKAHIQIGDIIEGVNQARIHSAADLQHVMDRRSALEPLKVQVRRGDHTEYLSIYPSVLHGQSSLGLYVRDRAAGVGTLTFLDSDNHRFGALGHVITDIDTGRPVDGRGNVYPAKITGLVKGQIGQPGEKRGIFNSADIHYGSVDTNSDYGVFGTMTGQYGIKNEQKLPIALPSQVHPGRAIIRTVLQGDRVDSFQVQIENVVRQSEPCTKSMVIHITDPRLLHATGGIIQGMSGSPVIQDGRLAGAVTHVFISDPTRGYGVFALWMYNKATYTISDKPLNTTVQTPAKAVILNR